MSTILEIFKSYNGTGYYCVLFIIRAQFGKNEQDVVCKIIVILRRIIIVDIFLCVKGSILSVIE